MLIFLSSFAYLCIAVMGYYRRDRFLMNPITVMFGIWAILIPLSSIYAYEVPPPSDKCLIIIFVGLMGYLLGNVFSNSKCSFAVNGHIMNQPETEYGFNYKILYVLYIISFVYLLSSAYVAITLMMKGYGLDYIRELVTAEGTNEIRSSYLSILIKNFIATPTVYLALAILPIDMIMGKRDKVLLFLTIVMTVCWVISSGGRSVILWMVLYFFVFYLFAKSKSFRIKVSKRIKRLAIIGGVLLLLLLLYTTYARKGFNVDLLRQLFIYYIAPVKHFDKYVELVDTRYTDFYGYGGASFYGFIYPVLFIGRVLSGRDGYSDFWVTVRELSFNKLEHTTWLGGNIHMNAFVTIFYQPYIDGRFVGVFVLCLFFGWMCGYTYKRAYIFRNIKYILLYLLFIQKIADSMVRFYFTQPAQAICLIFALFAVVKKGKDMK